MVFLSSEQLNPIWSESLVSWILDSNLQQDSGFLVLDSGFQSPGFRIPQAKNSWIPESGFPYMGRILPSPDKPPCCLLKTLSLVAPGSTCCSAVRCYKIFSAVIGHLPDIRHPNLSKICQKNVKSFVWCSRQRAQRAQQSKSFCLSSLYNHNLTLDKLKMVAIFLDRCTNKRGFGK